MNYELVIVSRDYVNLVSVGTYCEEVILIGYVLGIMGIWILQDALDILRYYGIIKYGN